jgi:hypothetical protein
MADVFVKLASCCVHPDQHSGTLRASTLPDESEKPRKDVARPTAHRHRPDIRSRTRSDVRIVVNGVSGPRPTIAKPKIVAVQPAPRVISGCLPLVHQQMVFASVRLNEAALVDYRAGVIGTADFARRLRTLPVIAARDDESPGERSATGCERLSGVTPESRR